jgi:cell wall-associated NlpC family hydrolase
MFEGRKRRLSVAALTAAMMLGAAIVPAISQTPARAGTIETLKEKAAALASQIDASYARLSILDEAYNQAETRVSELKTAITAQDHAIGASEKRLSDDNAHLRTVAIDAYVNGTSSELTVLFSGNQQQLPMQQAYLSAASGNLNQALSTVEIDRHLLTAHKQQLQHSEAVEVAAKKQISTDISTAQTVTASLESTLSGVKGQLAQAVAAQERAQAAAAAAAAAQAAAAQAAAEAAAHQPPPPPPPVTQPSPPPVTQPSPPPVTQPSPPVTQPSPPPPTITGGGSGAVAVKAAESQLGVPYVWGGATPGVGFDCSGLVMWAWDQAGVSLAHGATDQYYEIAHVSMSNLEPGDLIFYGDSSYLYHVVMYVGSGPYGADTVIQAEETGTNVMLSPMPPGAYGAGQP